MPSFWEDTDLARRKMQRLTAVKGEVEEWRTLESDVVTLDELVGMIVEEKDDALWVSAAEEAERLADHVEDLELKLVLSGPYDDHNAILALHAGAGGVDSQDWSRMLLRMYSRWAERQGYATDVLEMSASDEGGIKSVMMQITGPDAFGYLKAEKGVHRLVRQSPFDADHARHTSFAKVEVLPEVSEVEGVEIKSDDLNIEVFKAGGAGGQSVQKNSTAVRITHIPTGIKSSCQNERSQYQNKSIAMRVLLARLAELEMEKRAKQMAELKGENVSAEWGNQIRSYVLHPYKLVKDHRSDYETSDAESVLDGDVMPLIRAYLKTMVGNKSPKARA